MTSRFPLSLRVRVAAGVAIVMSLFLATRWGLALTAPLRSWARPVTGPLASWAHARAEKTRSRESLMQERDVLAGEVARLTSSARDHAVCQEENAALKELLRYRAPSGFETVSARVVSYVNAERTQLRIDQGAAHGVQKGAAAVSGEGILWGRVTNVERASAVVSLLTDPALAVPARAARSAPHGIVRRDEQGGLILDLIPLNASLELDAPVLTTELDERMPSGLIVGRVARVARLPHAPFLRVEVTASPLRPPIFLYVVVQRVAE